MGEFKDAEPYLNHSLEMERAILGQENMQLCKSLNHLGLFYQIQGDLVKAEQTYARILQIMEKMQFAKRPESDSNLNYLSRHLLAMVYCAEGKRDEALGVCKDTEDSVVKNTGPGGRDISMDLHGVALRYCTENHYQEAQRTCKWLLHVFAEKLQKEYLGAVVQGEGISVRKLQIMEEMLQPSFELLARYDDVWRPSEIFRDEVLPKNRLRKDRVVPITGAESENRISQYVDNAWRP